MFLRRWWATFLNCCSPSGEGSPTLLLGIEFQDQSQSAYFLVSYRNTLTQALPVIATIAAAFRVVNIPHLLTYRFFRLSLNFNHSETLVAADLCSGAWTKHRPHCSATCTESTRFINFSFNEALQPFAFWNSNSRMVGRWWYQRGSTNIIEWRHKRWRHRPVKLQQVKMSLFYCWYAWQLNTELWTGPRMRLILALLVLETFRPLLKLIRYFKICCSGNWSIIWINIVFSEII